MADGNDPVLLPLIEAGNESERRTAIECLLSQAKPVIASVIARNRTNALRADDADEIAATVALRLIRRLQSVAENAISNFNDFTARLAQNAVYELLRARFPARARLKNRLRYVLLRDERFATWLADDASIAGLRSWAGRMDLAHGASVPPLSSAPRETGDAIEAVLIRAGGPLALNDLTTIIAGLWGVSDAIPDDVPEPHVLPVIEQQIDTRRRLGALWREIETLSPQQRAALLLNLRDSDGYNAVALFVAVGVTGIDDIAAALEMTTDQLSEVWNDLPLDDLTIASLLGKTRQQVINLRKSARERLARRVRK
jgi:DNA-directed RNA polymerase specialized sigma24 family protein